MNWRKWLDGFVLAGKGVLLATKEKRFWVGFALSFLFFGTLMNFMGTLANFDLIRLGGPAVFFREVGRSFLATFGLGRAFLDWLPVFLLALLQGTLIGLIALLWQKRQKPAKKSKGLKDPADSHNSENVQRAGLITGLIALGAGCPTCGTTLVTPLIGAFVSTGATAIAGVVSTVVTYLAVLVAILSLRRLGEETYVIIINEKYLLKRTAAPANDSREPAKKEPRE